MLAGELIRPWDTPPLIPSMLVGARRKARMYGAQWDGVRYARAVPVYDPDVQLLRQEVQDGGPGLYVFEKHDGSRALVEAYYPPEIRASWYERNMDPLRDADYKDGRLIVVNELLNYRGYLNPLIAVVIRKTNRAAWKHLKRQLNVYERELARREVREAVEKADWDRANADGTLDEVLDGLVELEMEARSMARGRVAVSQFTGGRYGT